MIFIYKMASGVRMSKNWIPRLRFLFLSFSQYVADYSDPRSRPFPQSYYVPTDDKSRGLSSSSILFLFNFVITIIVCIF